MNVKQLVEQLNAIATKASALLKEFEGKTMPAEKLAEFERLHTEGMELKSKIEAARELESKQRDLGALHDFLDRPQPTAPMPVGPSGADDGRKALAERGWEYKGGMWCAKTSLGLYPLYSEEVLFGKVPEKGTKDEIGFFRTARAAIQPQYRGVFDKWIRKSVESRSESMAFASLEGWEQKALSEGTDTAGGFLVPPEYQAEMLVRKAAAAAVRAAGATVQPTSRDLLRYPRVQPAAATASGLASGGDSIFSSGFVGSWAGETPAFSDTDPAFGTFDIAVKKIRVATKLANDFIADSVVDVIAFLARNGAQNMALVEDQGFITGDGSALKPKGFLNNGARTTNIAGTTANTISNTSATVGSAPKLITLVYKLPPQYAQNAQAILSRGSEGAVRGLVDGQNRPLWPELASSGYIAGSPQSLLGFPRRNSQFMVDGSVANSGAVAIALGDFSAYIIAERAQISTVVLRERFADTDQTGIILWERVGGDTWNPDAFSFGTL